MNQKTWEQAKEKLRPIIQKWMEENIHSKSASGRFLISIFHDGDKMSYPTMVDILIEKDPISAFYEQICEWYDDAIYREEIRVVNQIMEDDEVQKIREDLYQKEQSLEFDDELRYFITEEFLDVEPPTAEYLKQEVPVIICLDTGDGNFDFVRNMEYMLQDDDEEHETASLLWLVKQQGYTMSDLKKAAEEPASQSNQFLRSVGEEYVNAWGMQTVVFLVNMSFELCLKLNVLIEMQMRNGVCYNALKYPDCGEIVIGKDTPCGLYSPWDGHGSVLDIKLEKDVELPVKYIDSAMPDAPFGTHLYPLLDCYGACESLFSGQIKEIRMSSEVQNLFEDKGGNSI